MTPRTMAARLTRGRQRAERRDTLLVLLARIDSLSPTEAALLVEYVHAELDASDHLRATIQGQQTAMQDAADRTRAAEAAIVEAERDRDQAVAAVVNVRAFLERRAHNVAVAPIDVLAALDEHQEQT
ncbi:hypothetical protein AB0D99_10515 [Streptomyces sp. NPDC047971]|uniref:hypothetical protein n=1 Tax=Streptomyces sp. NPDC047971 TaxID=3154499 RepID=UPI003406D5CF